MPIGAAKLGVLGAGLVPGGTETFNAPGTFSIPPGVKKVSITGRGGSGNPGNSGTAGNAGNAGGGGGGGGGAFAAIYQATPGIPVTAPSQNIIRTAGSGGSSPGGGNGGAAGVNPNPCVPNTPAPTSVAGSSGNAGNLGNAGSAGSAGNPGNAGSSSSGLGQNFAGGAGGNAGNAGAAGNAGTGGTGGGGGGSNTVPLPSPVATPGLGGNGGGPGVNANSYVPTSGPGNSFVISKSYNVCAFKPFPTCAPASIPFNVEEAFIYGYPGGGGAGEINNGFTLNFTPGPTFNHVSEINLFPRAPGPVQPPANQPLQCPQYIAPFNCPVTVPKQRSVGFSSTRSAIRAHIISTGGTPGGGRGGFGRTQVNTLVTTTPAIPNPCGGGPGSFGCPSRCPSMYIPGLAASNARAGGGGGGAGAGGGSLSGGAGGGGGRGNAGNAGGAGGSGGTGATGTPATFNCVPVTPGGTAPITVASPGGQIVISWNPQ